MLLCMQSGDEQTNAWTVRMDVSTQCMHRRLLEIEWREAGEVYVGKRGCGYSILLMVIIIRCVGGNE